ncbi:MAG: hypothetical protein E7408_03990 [Ruminococcaceae bacterium]|nr:hypothetical protein [Oscillospiraceae bacterium]
MLFTLMPMTAWALYDYSVAIGNKNLYTGSSLPASDGDVAWYTNGANGTDGEVTSVNPGDGAWNAKLSYSSETGYTLTLHGLNLTDTDATDGICVGHADIKLELIGANTVTVADKNNGDSNGIFTGKDLTIAGTGTLDVVSGRVDGGYESYGISASGDIHITGGTVTAEGYTNAFKTVPTIAQGFSVYAGDDENAGTWDKTTALTTYKYVKIEPVVPHSHPICGETHTDIGGHIGECADVEWTAWDGSKTLTDGNYYFADNVQTTSIIKINGEVNICLNGRVIEYTGTTTGSVFRVEEGGTLNLCDCQSTEHKFTPDENGKWVLDEENGTETLNGGIITGGNANDGCGICVYGTLNQHGGHIVGNGTDYFACRGAGVYVDGDTDEPALYNLYGGSVTGNLNEDSSGGGIYFNRGNLLHISGGTITGNTDNFYKSGIVVSGKLNLSGAPNISENGETDIYFTYDHNKAVLSAPLVITTPINVNKEYDEGVFAEADGTTLTDLAEYKSNFRCADDTCFIEMQADTGALKFTQKRIV